jgi:hypothetical protein
MTSSFPLYRSRQAGTGFVAAHVWRQINPPELASRNPLTYSFVPNLVWLPAQVAGLSGIEGSFVQRFLQRVSLKIFKESPVARPHLTLVTKIWEMLPQPPEVSKVPLPELEDVSFFDPPGKFFSRRAAMIRRVGEAMRDGRATSKVISTRYTTGLPCVRADARSKLSVFVLEYAAAVDGG